MVGQVTARRAAGVILEMIKVLLVNIKYFISIDLMLWGSTVNLALSYRNLVHTIII